MRLSFIKGIAPIVLSVAMSAFTVSCTEENSTKEPFSVYWSGVTEISPSTNLNITPTYKGGTPADFAIESVTFDKVPYSTESFSIDPATGVFSISSTDGMPVGTYRVSVSCVSKGKSYRFDDAIVIEMMNPVPQGIVMEPASIVVKAADVMSQADSVSLPTAAVTTDGSHVSIKGYVISSVKLNGEASDEYKAWFSISKDGVVSITPGNADIIPGVYTFDFKLNTYIAGSNSEMGLFKNALSVNVTSAPMALSFSNPAVKVERGYASMSAEPAIKGSKEGLTFAIKSVSPDNAIGITINPATGAVSFPETDKTSIGDVYKVSISATNEYGTMDFDEVLTFTVINFIFPIEGFGYDAPEEVISGASIKIPAKLTAGDDVTYSFSELPAGLEGLKIDPATGLISCQKGTELTPGEYTVNVKATNIKGSETVTFTLKISPNPYKFTYVRWGNNLGLSPIEKYGNQFRIKAEDGEITIPVLESDIPEGMPVEYTLKNKNTHSSNFPCGAKIDSESGTVTLKYEGGEDFSQSRTHVVYITVKVGGKAETAVSKVFPFFIDQFGYCKAGYNVSYTPFAFRVNPRTGGRSAEPVVTNSKGASTNGFTLDFRRNLFYNNLYGPVEHGEGRLDQKRTECFLYAPAKKYFDARNVSVNTGSSDPFAYWNNASRGTVNLTACYVDPETLQMVVNPEKFSDDYGYANGLMYGEMLCNINNTSPSGQNSDYRLFPIIIWFDPDYTE